MTQLSWQWNCVDGDGIGDGAPMSAEKISDSNSFMANVRPETSGIVNWSTSNADAIMEPSIVNAPTGLLNATESGGVVTMDTGVAMVQGWMYVNDASVDFDINGNAGNANATDIIALRRSDLSTGREVRLVRLNGLAGQVADLTQDSDTWEIPLWYVNLDGSGEFSSLDDRRRCVEDNLTVTGESLATESLLITMPPVGMLYNNCRITVRVIGTGIAGLGMRFDGEVTNTYTYQSYDSFSFGISQAQSTTGISLQGNPNPIFNNEATVEMILLNKDAKYYSGMRGAKGSMMTSPIDASGLSLWLEWVGYQQSNNPISTIELYPDAIFTADWYYSLEFY